MKQLEHEVGWERGLVGSPQHTRLTVDVPCFRYNPPQCVQVQILLLSLHPSSSPAQGQDQTSLEPPRYRFPLHFPSPPSVTFATGAASPRSSFWVAAQPGSSCPRRWHHLQVSVPSAAQGSSSSQGTGRGCLGRQEHLQTLPSSTQSQHVSDSSEPSQRRSCCSLHGNSLR